MSKHKKKSSKKEKKLTKIIESADSADESEHELSYYINDRVKLMKEVLKIIPAKKIKSMAPDCIKNLDGAEINSMLLEELLGISNKRLKYIFSGENEGDDASSSSTDEDVKNVKTDDVISLDDISDDDFAVEVIEEPSAKRKKIKKEKKSNKQKVMDIAEKLDDKGNMLSVLELLELQARARAIRSQLLLEKEQNAEKAVKEEADEEDGDEVIIESPKHDEIVISDSDNSDKDEESAPNGENLLENVENALENEKNVENEENEKNGGNDSKTDSSTVEIIVETESSQEIDEEKAKSSVVKEIIVEAPPPSVSKENTITQDDDQDGIVINVDEDEIIID